MLTLGTRDTNNRLFMTNRIKPDETIIQEENLISREIIDG